MSIFHTPPKNWLTKASLIFGIVASPVVVFAHFLIRDFHGDYGLEDSIMIPIGGYVILAFPFALLYLVLDCDGTRQVNFFSCGARTGFGAVWDGQCFCGRRLSGQGL
jgi:hypothetical protein